MPTLPRNKIRHRLTNAHPLRKKRDEEKRQKMILKNLYNLPLTIKVKIFQMSIAANMLTWKKDHMTAFHDALEFIDSGHNENPHKNYGEGRINDPPCAAPPRGIEKNGEWFPAHIYSRYYDYGDDELPIIPEFKAITLCSKTKEQGISGEKNVVHIKLPPEASIPINLSERRGYFTRPAWDEFSDSDPDQKIYWYHKKCRCWMCDFVRYTLYKKGCYGRLTCKYDMSLPEKDTKIVWGKFWPASVCVQGTYEMEWHSTEYSLKTNGCRMSLEAYSQYINQWDEKNGCDPSDYDDWKQKHE